MRMLTLGLMFMAASWGVFAADRPDLVLADFEGNNYGEWHVEGEAFGPGPATGTLPGQMRVQGFLGNRLANSFFQGDKTTGTLTSPEFVIERPHLNFLVGGGGYPDETYVELVVGGEPVRKATGPNTRPGGSELLDWHTWDVREFQGKRAQIRIVDRRTGGWGHINVDQIVQSDRRAANWIENAKREFTIDKRYLNIPIKNGAPVRAVTVLVDGVEQVRNNIELADAEPDWWAFMDVSAWRGKSLTLQVDRLREDSKALSAIEQSEKIRGDGDLYREPLRGQFHFSSRRGWNNDPNGLCFYNGEYHLFYQHNPYGWNWGNMHWGHAVSRDLVHWRELGEALAPDELGTMYSGSAVVDVENTSGFGEKGKAPMVLIYTAAGKPFVQCIASSTDGRAFSKYKANPVLDEITGGNRDPKVIWHEPTRRWVMVLYVGLPGDKHTVQFFTSPNLRDWTFASLTEGGAGDDRFLFECPDFFELPVDGDMNRRKWVLMGANTEYAVGSFDGTKFTAETAKLPGHRGRGLYAPQTFSDIPPADGRRIQVGWLQTATPGMPFNQSMSIPTALRLVGTDAGPRLTWSPVKELESLRTKSFDRENMNLQPESPNPLEGIEAELVELRAVFEPSAAEISFNVRGAKIVFDGNAEEITVNGHRAPAPLRGGKQRLAIFCDRTALEVFASDGLTYVPMPFTPKPSETGLTMSVAGGGAKIKKLQCYNLKSAWETAVAREH